MSRQHKQYNNIHNNQSTKWTKTNSLSSKKLDYKLPEVNKHKIANQIVQNQLISQRHKMFLQKQLQQQLQQKIIKLRHEGQKIIKFKEKINKIYDEDQNKKFNKLRSLEKRTAQINKKKQELMNKIIQRNKVMDNRRKQIHKKVRAQSEQKIIQSNQIINNMYNTLQNKQNQKNMILKNKIKAIQQNRFIVQKDDPTINVDKNKLFSKSIYKPSFRKTTNQSRLSMSQSDINYQNAKKITQQNFQQKLEKAVKKVQGIQSARKTKEFRFQKALSEALLKKQTRAQIMNKNIYQIQKLINNRNQKIIQEAQINRKKLQIAPLKKVKNIQTQAFNYRSIPIKTLSPSYHREIKNKLHGLTLYFYNSLKSTGNIQKKHQIHAQ